MEGPEEVLNMLRHSRILRRRNEEPAWKRRIQAYRHGGSKQINWDDENEVRTFLVRTVIQMLLPALYFQNPEVLVSPQYEASNIASQSANIMEAWLNYFLGNVINTKKQTRRAIIDALVMNKGFVETGWELEYLDQPIDSKVDTLQYVKEVIKDNPYILRKSPWDVLTDPYATDGLNDARWAAIRMWLPFDYVKNNRAFNSRARSQIDSPDTKEGVKEFVKHHLNPRRNPRLDRKLDDEHPEGLSIVWKVYDRKYNRRLFLSSKCDKFLLEEDNPYAYLNTFPLLQLDFEFDTDCISGTNIVDEILFQQNEYNNISRRQHDNLKRFSRVIGVPDGVLSDGDEGERRLKEAKDGDIVRINQGRNKDEIGEINWSRESPEFWNLRSSVKSEALFTARVPPTALGTGHPKFKSATEVAQIGQRFDVRMDDLREQVADWFEAIVTQVGEHIKYFLDDDRKNAISSVSRQMSPGELLTSDFSYKTNISETYPENRQTRLQRLSTLYKLTQNDPLFDRHKLLMEIADEMGFKNPQQYLMQNLPGNAPVMGGEKTGGSPKGIMGMVPEQNKAMISGGQKRAGVGIPQKEEAD